MQAGDPSTAAGHDRADRNPPPERPGRSSQYALYIWVVGQAKLAQSESARSRRPGAILPILATMFCAPVPERPPRAARRGVSDDVITACSHGRFINPLRRYIVST